MLHVSPIIELMTSDLHWSELSSVAGNLCRSDLHFPQLGTSVRCRCLTRRRCLALFHLCSLQIGRSGVHRLECERDFPPMTSSRLYDVIRRGGCVMRVEETNQSLRFVFCACAFLSTHGHIFREFLTRKKMPPPGFEPSTFEYG